MDGLTFLRKIMALAADAGGDDLDSYPERRRDDAAKRWKSALSISSPSRRMNRPSGWRSSRQSCNKRSRPPRKCAWRAPCAGAAPRRAAFSRRNRKDHFCRRFDRWGRGAQDLADRSAGRLPADADHPAYAAAVHDGLCPEARPRVPDESLGGGRRRCRSRPVTSTSRRARITSKSFAARQWTYVSAVGWSAGQRPSSLGRCPVPFGGAAYRAKSAVAAILTGMGKDGAEGLLESAPRRRSHTRPG